jgi:hypothetical protein
MNYHDREKVLRLNSSGNIIADMFDRLTEEEEENEKEDQN